MEVNLLPKRPKKRIGRAIREVRSRCHGQTLKAVLRLNPSVRGDASGRRPARSESQHPQGSECGLKSPSAG